MIPSARLAWLALAPLALSLAAVADETLLWPMLALDAGVLLVALVDAVLGRRALVAVERSAPAILSLGRQNPIGIELRSRAGRPLAVEVRDDLFAESESSDLPVRAVVPPRDRVAATYHVRPSRRGAYEIGDHHVRYPTPLGLWLRQIRVACRSKVRVYPDVQSVRAYEMLARQQREAALTRAVRMRGGENEFERLRDYLPDDEFRSIDWKATARRQRLIAREYQLERNQNVVCLLDCGRLMTAETEGVSHLDHALNATLMMSHVAARTGDQVGLLAFDSRVRTYVPPAGGRRAAQRIIQASYHLHPSLVESDYDAAFDILGVRLRKRSLVVLFTEVIDDVAAGRLLRLMRGLHPRHLPLLVLYRDVDLDQMVDPAGGPEAGVADLYGRGAAAEMIVWRDRFVREIGKAGTLVLYVPPRKLTPALVSRYLEIKARQLL